MSYWWFWLAFSLNVLVHELGHAAVLLLFRHPIQKVVWGFGPRLLSIGWFELRLVPISGRTVSGVRTWAGRERQGAWYALGGALAQGILCWLFILIGVVHVLPSFMVWWLVATLLGFLQLLPFRFTDGGLLRACLASRSQTRKDDRHVKKANS